MKKPLKSLISIFLTLLMLMPAVLPVNAAETELTDSNLTYVIDGNVLTIKGTGAMPGWTDENPSPFMNNTAIEKIVLEEGVTDIGYKAFAGCTNIQEADIPASCKNFYNIFNEAFSGAPVKFYIDKNHTELSSADGIIYSKDKKTLCFFAPDRTDKKITVPEGTEIIYEQAFNGAVNIEEIALPSSLKEIAPGAIIGCTKLAALTIPENVNFINSASVFMSPVKFTVSDKNSSFSAKDGIIYSKDGKKLIAYGTGRADEKITIPEGTEIIGGETFAFCENLKNIILPASLKEIEKLAFYNCKNIKDIFIPAAAERIDISAFRETGIKLSVDKNNKIFTAAEGSLFSGNGKNLIYLYRSNPAEIIIPEGVETIAEGFFAQNKTVEKAVLPDSLKIIPGKLFYNCDNLKEVTFGKNTGRIENSAFESCNSLTEINLPSALKYIGDSAFESCSSLAQVSFSKGLQYIGEISFGYCKELKEINIPDSVKYIDSLAFVDCEKLESANFPAEAEYISGRAFSGTPFMTALEKRLENENDVLYVGKNKKILYRCFKSNGIYTVKDGTEIIAGYAFEGIKYIKTVNLPETVKVIDESAFYQSPLQKINVPRDLIYVGGYAFKYTDFLEKQADGCFYFGKVLADYKGSEAPENLVIRDGTLAVSSDLFYNSDAGKKIKSLTLPESILYIGGLAFYGCDALREVKIPQGTKYAGFCSFGNPGLEKIYIPGKDIILSGTVVKDTVKIYGEKGSAAERYSAVKENEFTVHTCSELIKVNAKANSTKEDGYKEHYKCSVCGKIYKDDKKTPVKWEDIRIPAIITGPCGDNITYKLTPDGVLTLSGTGEMDYGIHPFKGRDDIKKVIIEKGVEIIPENTFAGCSNLQEVILPEGLKYIGFGAFAKCPALKKLHLPASLEAAEPGFAIFSPVSFTVSAESKKYKATDGMLYSKDGKTLFAYGTGKPDKKLVIPENTEIIATGALLAGENLNEVILPSSLKEIGFGAFTGCSNLKTLKIPSGVEKIEFSAFNETHIKPEVSPENKNFSSKNGVILSKDGKTVIAMPVTSEDTEITVPDGVEVLPDELFTFNRQVKKINLPASLKHIGNETFYYCTSLTEINLPEGLLSIGKESFYNCESLKKIKIPDSLKVIAENAFGSCESLSEITWGKNTEIIEDRAFSECGLTELKFPESLIKIENSAFYSCSKLKKVTFNKNIKVLEDDAFAKCDSLTDMNLPENAGYIGGTAIYYTPFMENLIAAGKTVYAGNILLHYAENSEEYRVKDGTTEIAYDAFYGSTGTKKVILPDSVKIIDEHAFCGSGIEEINVPANLQYVGYNAFGATPFIKAQPEGIFRFGNVIVEYLGKIPEKITVPEGITAISERAFSPDRQENFAEAKNLKTLVLPGSLKYIGERAFYACSSLTEVKIPGNVKAIGDDAFRECSLKKVYIYNKDCEIDESLVFNDGVIIVAPSGSKVQDYAERYNIKFEALPEPEKPEPEKVMTGDVDGDKKITAADARLALRASVKLENLTPIKIKAADINKDNKITAADARIILRVSVGLEKFR